MNTIDNAITCHGQSWSGIGCIVCIDLENALHENSQDKWVDAGDMEDYDN